MSLQGFDSPRLALIIKGGKRLFPSKKRDRFPITKDILERITEEEPLTVDDLNTDTAFKVAWAGFMRMGEITYTATEAKKASFSETKVTRSDISFAEGDQYAILRLKRSKTDTEHTGVSIILAATGEKTCPVRALRRLFIQDPRPLNAPLFRFSSSAFSRQNVVAILKKRIGQAGLFEAAYSGHSFRKGAAQHAADHGMLDESIQRLGRWTSNAFTLHFTTSPEALFNLNLSFQKGIPLAVPRATTPSAKANQLLRVQDEETRTYQSPYPPIYPTQPYIPTTNTSTPLWALPFGRQGQPGQVTALPLPGNAPSGPST